MGSGQQSHVAGCPIRRTTCKLSIRHFCLHSSCLSANLLQSPQSVTFTYLILIHVSLPAMRYLQSCSETVRILRRIGCWGCGSFAHWVASLRCLKLSSLRRVIIHSVISCWSFTLLFRGPCLSAVCVLYFGHCANVLAYGEKKVLMMLQNPMCLIYNLLTLDIICILN